LNYKVIWSKFSEEQIDDIFAFYEQKSKSYDVALKIVTKIIFVSKILTKNPRLGQKEFLLENREIEYHYLIEDNWKIIYSIDDKNKTVKIVDVFDCRQEPEKIKREK